MLADNDLKELWDVARNHTILLDKYISSRRYKTKQERVSNTKNVTSDNIYYVAFYKIRAFFIIHKALLILLYNHLCF